MSLHQQIMNLPCNPPKYMGEDHFLNAAFQAYAQGHRDARHAAAEIAAKADKTIKELREALIYTREVIRTGKFNAGELASVDKVIAESL